MHRPQHCRVQFPVFPGSFLLLGPGLLSPSDHDCLRVCRDMARTIDADPTLDSLAKQIVYEDADAGEVRREGGISQFSHSAMSRGAAGNSAFRLPDGPGLRWPDKGARETIEFRSRLVRGQLAANPCSWNMRRRHSSHGWPISAARTAVKGALILRVHRSEAQTLDGRHSEGYTRSAFLTVFAWPFVFNVLNIAALQSALFVSKWTHV
jgi:hypothetical protein